MRWPGIAELQQGDIAYCIILEESVEGPMHVEQLWQPKVEDIIDALAKYPAMPMIVDLSHIIRESAPGVYGFMFDLPKIREAYQKGEFDDYRTTGTSN